jgi:hypothetical protein
MTVEERDITDNIILKSIAKEIEEKYNCKVVGIRFAQLISLCVDFKIQFNDDFLYKPLEDLPKPEMIWFSERTASFYRRVDLFDCVKNKTINN